MIKYLSIGPGAMGFYLYLGTISRLKDAGKLDDLLEISGASAGSLLGFMYCLMKGDVRKILDYSLKVPVKDIMKINLKIFFKKFGLISSGKIKKILSEMCSGELNKPDITFRELYEFFPVKLHLTAYCIQLEKTTYFSVDTTPDISVLDVICASIAIPFLFCSVKIGDGLTYLDGGSIESTPSGVFMGNSDVYAMRLGYTGWNPDVKDIKSYALSLLYATMKLRYEYPVPTQQLVIKDDIFDFGASSESKIRMYTSGYSQEFSQ
jgi:predicted acylesterase/phospholipase RssA